MRQFEAESKAVDQARDGPGFDEDKFRTAFQAGYYAGYSQGHEDGFTEGVEAASKALS
jgi:hypothetical protein